MSVCIIHLNNGESIGPVYCESTDFVIYAWKKLDPDITDRADFMFSWRVVKMLERVVE